MNESDTIVREDLVLFERVDEIDTASALSDPANDAVEISAEAINAANDDTEMSGWEIIEELVKALGRASSLGDSIMANIMVLRLGKRVIVDSRKILLGASCA